MGHYHTLNMRVDVSKETGKQIELFQKEGILPEGLDSHIAHKMLTHEQDNVFNKHVIVSFSKYSIKEDMDAALDFGSLIISVIIKNYENEIQTFLDWLSSHLSVGGEIQFIGTIIDNDGDDLPEWIVTYKDIHTGGQIIKCIPAFECFNMNNLLIHEV